jgi:nucleoside-triphosphatase
MSGSASKNLLLTGRPGCGKTTVVCRVIERLAGRRLAGFYTQEIRQHGNRLGFEAIGLGGGRCVLAHVSVRSKWRVGRYGVELDVFNALLRDELDRPSDAVDVFIIDEIGKMECCSEVFVQSAARVLSGPVPLLATIAARGGGLISQVKDRPDVEIVTVSAENRDGLPGQLVDLLTPRQSRPGRSNSGLNCE